MKLALFLFLYSLVSCKSIQNQNLKEVRAELRYNHFISSDGYKHSLQKWLSKENSNYVIVGIHGYSDYSNAFKIPSEHFNKFGIDLYSFDLRGFGRNIDNGQWVNTKLHEKDISEFVNLIKSLNTKKKIFLLGESMGGILAINTLISEGIEVDGVILVAPAIWNFSEKNFFKSKVLSLLSFCLPDLTLEGGGLLNVKPSDNYEMLREFSIDPNVVHKKSLKSLNGIKVLMDQSYNNFLKYLKKVPYKTLLIIPLNDQIVPRKPLNEIISTDSFKKFYRNSKLQIATYSGYHHMILRDIDGVRVTNEIKDWIINPKSNTSKSSFYNVIDQILDEPFYHRLD